MTEYPPEGFHKTVAACVAYPDLSTRSLEETIQLRREWKKRKKGLSSGFRDGRWESQLPIGFLKAFYSKEIGIRGTR